MYHSTIRDKKEYFLLKSILNKEKIIHHEPDKRRRSRLYKKASKFHLFNDKLYFIGEEGYNKEAITDDDVENMYIITAREHAKQHFGYNKTLVYLNSLYHRIKSNIILDVIRECKNCSQSQPLKHRTKMLHITARNPRERMQVDCIDLSKWKDINYGYTYILNIIDVYSKFCMACPIKDKSAATVKHALKKVFYQYGFPQIMQTDNGKEFRNSIMADFCRENNVVQKFSRPRHPQSNGQVERANQTITRWLQKSLYELSEKRWIEIFDKIVYDYNKTIHAATQKSPFQLFLKTKGYNTQIIQENNSESEDRDAYPERESYIKRMFRNAPTKLKENTFSIGDEVLVKEDFDNNQKTKKLKLNSFYSEVTGVIVEIINENIVVIKMGEKNKKVFTSQLKKIN